MGEIKCKNYELCSNYAIPEINGKYCMGCGSWFKFGGNGWDELTQVTTTDENKQCAVCFEDCDKKILFPTKCGHSFCVGCSKDILIWDESRYRMSQVPYGCPPCPNGCNNPEVGMQCNCYEYDEILELWEENNPNQYGIWNICQDRLIETSGGDVVYGQKTCPLCRSKYKRYGCMM